MKYILPFLLTGCLVSVETGYLNAYGSTWKCTRNTKKMTCINVENERITRDPFQDPRTR